MARDFNDGSPNTGRVRILDDLDQEGTWAQLMHPNPSRLGIPA